MYLRPGFETVDTLDANVTILNAPLLNISATEIRDSIKDQKTIRYLVPENVRKEIDIKEIKKNGKIEYIIDKKKKIMENERINSLIKVMNLNYSYNYDLTPEGDKEYKTLRYGKVLIATDADVDGLGMICSLILNFFNVFFPKLLERKVINIFATPLIRFNRGEGLPNQGVLIDMTAGKIYYFII